MKTDLQLLKNIVMQIMKATEGSPDAYVISPLRDLRNIIQSMQDTSESQSVQPTDEEIDELAKYIYPQFEEPANEIEVKMNDAQTKCRIGFFKGATYVRDNPLAFKVEKVTEEKKGQEGK